MAKKRRSSRRRGGGSRRGFATKEILAAVGGAGASAFFGPMIARVLPASIGSTPAGAILGNVLVGGLGYMALRKFNHTAALAFAGASIGPAIASMVGSIGGVGPAALRGYGYGEPDGVNYLPDVSGYLAGDDELAGDDDDLAGDDELVGMGEYDSEYVDA